MSEVDWAAPPELWWHPHGGVIARSRYDDGLYFAMGGGEGPITTLAALPEGALRYGAPEVAAPPREDEDGWEPDPRDPHERFEVTDPWDHPGWPLAARIIAAVTDSEPRPLDETDGVDSAVIGLLADENWRGHVAMADAMGLVGDWGVEDVAEAVTEAMHEYRLGGRAAAPGTVHTPERTT